MQDLAQLMVRLRSETGCPWDRKQTWHSLTPYTIEEAYEVVEAVESSDGSALKDELGDLLFHVVFYSQIAQEEQQFSLTEVIQGITEKMTRRHPHVFGDQAGKVQEADEVPGRWEEIKRQERTEKRQRRDQQSETDASPVSVFDDINSRVPALLWASKVQRKMGQVGFDWADAAGVFNKMSEEMNELSEAHLQQDQAAITEEVGDLLFTLVNLSRHLKVNPEVALRQSTYKFQNRFRYMENRLHRSGQTAQEATLDELEMLWQESKLKNKDTSPHTGQGLDRDS
ncbi:MAG: nucleoside triphosphate pyrophosphohydrolase [Magnetococcales bacterium]|nr:nucleoside triphosphate pyrophosphohydrolase [Magnetococcales bacterium]